MSAAASHPGTVAGVYAAALLAVAGERGTTAEVVAACRELPSALDLALVARLDSPRLGKDRAKQVLAAALAAAPREVRDLLLLLVDRNRLADAPAILAEAVARHEADAGIVQVHLRTAVPLAGPALDGFTRSIRRTFGEQAVIDQQVEPALIGGFTALVGDRYLDASVRRRLSEMKARMLATQLSDDALWAKDG